MRIAWNQVWRVERKPRMPASRMSVPVRTLDLCLTRRPTARNRGRSRLNQASIDSATPTGG